MRVLKITGVAIGALFILIVAAVAVVALTFDPNDYKDHAQAWVEERTGRSLTIDGDIELSLFPWLAVETGHIELGNAPEFGAQPFAAAQRISARIRLLPLLLNRELEVGTVSADALELELAVAEDGTTNWADLLAALSQADPASEGAGQADTAEGSATVPALNIEGIQLRGSRITWREDAEPRIIASELSLSTGAITPETPIDMNLEVDLLDVATQRTAHIALSSTAAMGSDGQISATDISADFLLGDAGGNIDADGHAEIESIGFSAGSQLVTGAVQITNTASTAVAARTVLASDLSWSALEADLAGMNFRVDDLAAAANDISTRWQLVGEGLNSDAAVLRGSVIIDDSPLAAAFELAGVESPAEFEVTDADVFSGSTAFVFEPVTGDVELSNLVMQAFGTELQIQQAVLRGDVLSAEVRIAPFQPNDAIRRLITAVLGDETDPSQIGTLALSASLFGTPADFSIREMQLTALGAQINGQLEVRSAADGFNVSGDIASNRFATDELLAFGAGWLPESITAATTGQAAVAGQFAWDAARRTLTVPELSVAAFGLQGTGEVNLSGFGSAIDAFGGITLQDFDPRNLLSRFSLAVPQTSDDSALRSARVDTRFSISPDTAAFEELNVTLDQTRMSGSFTVNNFADPFYRFSISADQINVDRYLPPQAPPGASGDDAPEEGERRAGDIALSGDALSAVNIDADVNVGELRIAGMDFSNVTTSMVVGEGRMLLDSAHADLYGGSFDGRFHVDAATDVPTMMLQGNAAGLQLTPLIAALAESANFSGTGSFNIDLTGRGPTVTDNLRSASGTMGFDLVNGTINGFNVDKSLCRAFNSVRGNPAPRDVPDQSTYEFIRGSADVSDGIATSNDLVANIGSAQVRGSGTLALADQVIDYNFDARLARPVPIAGCEEMERIVGNDFPLDVRGPLTAPEIAPDYNEVVRRILEYRIREEVRDRLLESIFD